MTKHAQSPAPEHIRFNPQSAFSVELSKNKEEIPVFSSKALENGRDAYGYQFLKQDFGWNEQMDLAWALGFPYFTIIVDGAPELEHPQYNPDNFQWNPNISIISRRTLWAEVHKFLTGTDPKSLSDEEYLKCTEERELTEEEINTLSNSTFCYLSSIIGPDRMAETIVCKIEDEVKKMDEDEDKYDDVLDAITPLIEELISLLRLVHKDSYQPLVKRATAWTEDWHCDGFYNEFYTEALLNPIKLADGFPGHSSTPSGQNTQWLDNHPEKTDEAMAELGFQNSFVPYRTLFTGSDKMFDKLLKCHKKIDLFTRELAYRDVFSSIKTTRLIPSLLAVWQCKRYTEATEQWFIAHKEFLLPELQKLGKKKGKYQDAANDMLAAIGEKPMAELVPKEKQKSLNPPDEWERTLKQIDKLEVEVIDVWGDDKAVKKTFQKHFKKCKNIAEEFGYDWEEEVFVEAWAETTFDKMTEEQSEMMNELYEEIVVD